MADEIVGEWLALVRADLDGAWSCAHSERPSLTNAAYLLRQAARVRVSLPSRRCVGAGPRPTQIDGWLEPVEQLQADFESWLGQRVEGR